MRHSGWRFLAAASLAAALAHAAVRPRYGGTLRVEMQAAPRTLDPGADGADERLSLALFETLTRLDSRGRLSPGLALSWRSDATARRWILRLRRGVKTHDGAELTPAAAASALAGLDAAASGDNVVVRLDTPNPNLPLELAQARRAVVIRGADGSLSGTGPFLVEQFEPGRRAVLRANEEHWEGRPFLDEIAFEFGRTPQQQVLDLDLGKADLVEVQPPEMRRVKDGASKVWSSAPVNLLAILFERGRSAAEDARTRAAVALSIDRAAIHSVLLQKQGEPAGALLPQWLSGYAFLFPAARDIPRARAAGAPATPLELWHDPPDALARAVAERVAVNARDAGLRVLVSGQAARPDMRLVRLRIHSVAPADALAEIAAAAGVEDVLKPADAGSPEAVYESERALVEDFRIVPLVHVPDVYASRERVRAWQTPGLSSAGTWRFEDLWIAEDNAP